MEHRRLFRFVAFGVVGVACAFFCRLESFGTVLCCRGACDWVPVESSSLEWLVPGGCWRLGVGWDEDCQFDLFSGRPWLGPHPWTAGVDS